MATAVWADPDLPQSGCHRPGACLLDCAPALPPPAHPFSEFRPALSGAARARSSPLWQKPYRQKPRWKCYLNCEESCNVTEADTPQASRLLRVRKKCLHMKCEVAVPDGVLPLCAAVFMDRDKEGHLVDALALRGDEGRGTLRKARGRCERSLIPGSPNGATHPRGYPWLNS
jgi:hypothetical protein